MHAQHLTFKKDRYTVTTDPSLFQTDAIRDYLSQSSWAPGIDEETVRQSVRTACVSVYWTVLIRLDLPGLSLTMPPLVISVTCTYLISTRRLDWAGG